MAKLEIQKYPATKMSTICADRMPIEDCCRREVNRGDSHDIQAVDATDDNAELTLANTDVQEGAELWTGSTGHRCLAPGS
jgi:hypothetical protein